MTADPARRMGRPDQQASEDLGRAIVDTARRLFIELGYAATSIEQIAAATGSGKQTIYRRFGSKEGLFTEVINQYAKRLLDLANAACESGADPIEALKENCRQLFELLQTQEVIELQRVLVAESRRFPAMGRYMLDHCMEPFDALQRRLLQAAMDAGQVRRMELDLAHTLLNSLFTGGRVPLALYGGQPFPSQERRDAYFEAAWALFLRGMS